MTKLIINSKITEEFPEIYISAIFVTNLVNTPSSDAISKLLSTEEERIRATFTKENFTENPNIQCWRNVYQKFGVKPRDAKSSVENLYRIILSGKDVRRVSALVDIYNYISLKYMIPLGGEDLDKISGDIHLTFAGENEVPVKLLGDEAPQAPNFGEVIYKDDISTICRRWNWRESERAKLTENTVSAVLIAEGSDENIVSSALEELAILIQEFCGGKIF